MAESPFVSQHDQNKAKIICSLMSQLGFLSHWLMEKLAAGRCVLLPPGRGEYFGKEIHAVALRNAVDRMN